MIRRAVIALLFAASVAGAQDWNTLGALWVEPSVVAADTNVYHVVTVRVTTNNQTFTMPIQTGTTNIHNFTVDWGDGSAISTITSNTDPDCVHAYASSSTTYSVTIKGLFGGWAFANGGDKALLRGITSWGCLAVTSANPTAFSQAFRGCNNLASVPTNELFARSWTNCTTMLYAFSGTAITIPPVISNLTKLTSIYAIFANSTSLKTAPYISSLTNADIRIAFYNSGITNTPDISGWVSYGPLLLDSLFESTSISTMGNVNGLTNVTSLSGVWRATQLTDASSVDALTRNTSLANTWASCTKLTNAASVSTHTNVTTMASTWFNDGQITNNIAAILQPTNWFSSGTCKTFVQMMYACRRATGDAMPYVVAITNAPGYPTGYNVTNMFYSCTNLTDYSSIPAPFN